MGPCYKTNKIDSEVEVLALNPAASTCYVHSKDEVSKVHPYWWQQLRRRVADIGGCLIRDAAGDCDWLLKVGC